MIQLDTAAGDVDRLLQGGHPLARELGSEPAPRIEVPEFSIADLPNLPVDTGDAHEIFVVEHDHLPVRRLLYIDLRIVGTVIDGRFDRAQRVLGRPQRAAAVRGDFDRPVELESVDRRQRQHRGDRHDGDGHSDHCQA